MVVGVFLIHIIFPVRYKGLIEGYCEDLGVESALVFAVVNTESHFDENAVSRVGAVGLMQIMPSTAEFVCDMLGIEYREADLYNADFNLRIGIFYLSYLLGRFDERSAIAAYNAGEGNVASWIAEQGALYQIPFEETRQYVSKVLTHREVYRLLV